MRFVVTVEKGTQLKGTRSFSPYFRAVSNDATIWIFIPERRWHGCLNTILYLTTGQEKITGRQDSLPIC